MRNLLSSALALLAAALPAQNASQGPIKVVDPPVLYPPLGPAGLSTPNCQVERVRQLELRRHPSFSSPSVFYVVAAIQATGEGRWKLCTGTFDCDLGTFQGDVVVDHATDSIWAGTVTHDLKTLVYETSTGFLWRSRTGVSGPFGAAAAVTGSPAGARDPKLALDDGPVWKLMWAMPSGAIQWAAYNVLTGTVTGAAVNLLNAASPLFHSPEPLRDPNGVARSLLLGREVGTGAVSDAWFASGKFNLPPGVAHFLHNQGTYLRGGTALGGTAFMPQGPAFGAPLKIDFAATNCDLQSGGGTATICHFFPYKPAVPDTEVVTVVLGVHGSSPITLPGIHGRLGLDPVGPLVFLPVQGAQPYTGVSCWGLSIPIGVAGIELGTQSILVRLGRAEVYLGNNSTLRIQ